MKLITDDGTELLIEQVRAIDLKYGDVIVLKTDQVFSPGGAQRLKDDMHRLFPNNKAFILEEGLEIEILRKKAEEK